MTILDTALKYLKMGLSIIPCGPDKKPLLKWAEFQKRIATEAEVKAWFNKWPSANVGIVTGLISGLAVIDIDDAEKAEPVLNELIPDSLVIPTASTPSGGKHLYFKITDSVIGNNAGLIPGSDLRANGGYVLAAPSVNGNGKGYAWLSGLSLLKVQLPALPEAYAVYINNICINNNSVCKGPVTPVTLSFDEGCRDHTLFHIANCLVKGGMPEAEILQTLDRLASACNPPFPENELEDKILSAIKRQEHRDFNLTREVERYISVTDGDFSVTDCDKALQSLSGVTIRDKNNIRQIFKRLKDKGIIQKTGTKDGIYRRVDDIAEEINWWDASTEPLKIRFPLEVEKYCSVYPKNIIIVAGEPNAGKTAFMLSLAIMNKDRKPLYLSSEMGPIELKTRLSKFDMPLSQWKAVRFKERCGNFADIVEPAGFTIIDFLEVTSDFYQIAALIKEIYDRLTTGICVIGIQKNKGRDTGRGGELGLEKPRLYIAMAPGKIKIVKAKAWTTPTVNPNSLQRDFKLIQGANFIANSPWHKEGEI